MTKLSALAVLLIISASSASAQDAGVYTNEKLKIRVTVPSKEYDVRSDEKTFTYKWKGSLCEIASKDNMVGGVLLHFASAMRADKYANWREQTWESTKGVKNYKRVAESTPKAVTQGTWLIRENVMEYNNYEYHYVTLYIANKRHNFELALWVSDAVWDEYKKSLYGILNKVRYGDLTSEEKPKTNGAAKGVDFANAKHGFQLRVPDGWKIREKGFQFGIEGSIVEFAKGESLAGVLGVHDGGLDPKAYSDAFVGGLKGQAEKFEVIKEGKTKGGTLRRDCRSVQDGLQVHYVLGCATHKKKNYFLLVWTAEAEWDTFKSGVNLLFDTWSFKKKDSGGSNVPSGKEIKVAKHLWKGMGEGSSVTYEVVSVFSGMESKSKMSYTLVKTGEKSYTIQTTMELPGGAKQSTTATYIVDPSASGSGGVGTAKSKTLGEGKESVSVAGKSIPCSWKEVETESGGQKTVTKTWQSADVPGGLVKTATKMKAGESTMTLIKFDVK